MWPAEGAGLAEKASASPRKAPSRSTSTPVPPGVLDQGELRDTTLAARGDRFKELVADLAMRVGVPDIEYISPDDVNPAAVEAERRCR